MPDILKFLEEIQRLKREKEELKILVAKLRDALMGLVKDLNELITQSGGVYGLHLNVDSTPWSDLLTGGKYEEWACQLIVEDCIRITETVREALAKLRQEMERRNTL